MQPGTNRKGRQRNRKRKALQRSAFTGKTHQEGVLRCLGFVREKILKDGNSYGDFVAYDAVQRHRIPVCYSAPAVGSKFRSVLVAIELPRDAFEMGHHIGVDRFGADPSQHIGRPLEVAEIMVTCSCSSVGAMHNFAHTSLQLDNESTLPEVHRILSMPTACRPVSSDSDAAAWRVAFDCNLAKDKQPLWLALRNGSTFR